MMSDIVHACFMVVHACESFPLMLVSCMHMCEGVFLDIARSLNVTPGAIPG